MGFRILIVVSAHLFEQLEPRQLLAAGIAMHAGGVIHVTGTSSDDDILLSQKGPKLTVNLNGQKKTYALKKIKKYRILADAGDDRVRFNKGSTIRPMYIDAGAGDDTIAGSRGKDRLIGGEGEDTINDKRWKNKIDG